MLRQAAEAEKDGLDSMNQQESEAVPQAGNEVVQENVQEDEVTEEDDGEYGDWEEGEEEEGEVDLPVDGEAGDVDEEALGDAVANMTSTSEVSKITDGSDINTTSFDELVLDTGTIQSAADSWQLFLNSAESKEAAGEAIYAALFEAAAGAQNLFTTPRAVQAMRFTNSFGSFVMSLDDPPKLRMIVETVGFSHMRFEVTPQKVVLFRDAFLDLFQMELGDKFTPEARAGWKALLNYIGGAIIFVKAHYAERIQTLLQSWKAVNDKTSKDDQFDQLNSADMGNQADRSEAAEKSEQVSEAKRGWFKARGSQAAKEKTEASAETKAKAQESMNANQTPTTYDEMFRFNAAVMGSAGSMWLNEVLAVFNNIVTNVSNANRLQEECDVLALRISKVAKGNINFSEYKSCMLASLRSLLPKDWSTKHEVAWTWLWETVERLLARNMGNPRKWERALTKFYDSLDESALFEIRQNLYQRFFASAPAGQDFFKQSNTYLHFIAERNMAMTLDLYRDPVKLVDDISAIGLRHVGYGIPTELFGPFVSCFVESVMAACTDTEAVESFRWSLGLISKITVRTIMEGSTIVMKAVNQDSSRALKKAIGYAPRAERATWLLLVQVGTQDISPLAWAIESGAYDAAAAMLVDLLTIRADRDRYYYSMDVLFKRHPDLIRRLVDDAPGLLPKLLDGITWRSRMVENGQRRVNYYIKHLLIDPDGNFSQNLAWLARTEDPKLVCHPVIIFASDTVWIHVARQTFMYGKSWMMLTLIIFITGQSVFKHLNEGENSYAERILVFSFRSFVYSFSMTQMIFTHLTKWCSAFVNSHMKKALGFFPYPKYLEKWQELVGFVLMCSLMMMLVLEPILYCLDFGKDAKLFWEDCPEADDIQYSYSIFSAIAMFLYYALLIDLAVLSTKVSAYVLVCMRMLSEVGLFILALSIMLLTFSSAISILKHEQVDFAGIHKGLLNLAELTAGMYDPQRIDGYEKDPVVVACIFVFLVCVAFFLINMLIAQFTCAYESVYMDMVGFARLERLQIINATMPAVRQSRWQKFQQFMRFDRKVEFNAGDVGVTGGVQILEPASTNPTTVDMIRRYGGSTSPHMPWPADEDTEGNESDQFDKLEKVIQKALKKAAGTGASMGKKGGGGTGTSSGYSGLGTGTGTATGSHMSGAESTTGDGQEV